LLFSAVFGRVTEYGELGFVVPDAGYSALSFSIVGDGVLKASSVARAKLISLFDNRS
jgi:hypothetical protein